MVYRLLHEEGIYIGASSALNVVAAVKVAEKLGKGELDFRSRSLSFSSPVRSLVR